MGSDGRNRKQVVQRSREVILIARYMRIFRESFWIAAGQAAAVCGSMVGIRFLTELLDPAVYGELALGMTIATLVNQAVFGPINNGVTRFYSPAVEDGDFGGYLNAVHRLILLSCGVIVIMALLSVSCLLISGLKEWIAIVIAAFFFSILSGFSLILSGIQSAARQRSIVALHQGIEPWLRFIVAAILLIWLGAASSVAMAGYAIGTIFVFGSQYVFFCKTLTRNFSSESEGKCWGKTIWNYSWPFTTFGLFTWAQYSSDRWALELYATAQDVGHCAVLLQLGYYPMSTVTGMVVQLLGPILFQRSGDASDSRKNADVSRLTLRLTWFILGLSTIGFAIAFMFHTQIFQIFVAKEYAIVSHLLPWMLFSGGVFAAGQTVALDLSCQMKTQIMITPKIITALFGTILNFVGAYFYGVTGIVIASVLFSGSYFIWMVVLSKHQGVEKCFREKL
jgi:O-antigen/teichoic acid export membrane protein